MTNIAKTLHGEIIHKNDNIAQSDPFTRQILHDSALACSNFRDASFDLEQATNRSKEAMTALDVSTGLQSMLAAQMLSIHQLQQQTMTYANGIDSIEGKKYYTNAAIKLAKCFVQQANMFAKLQGVGQKITIERVDVHHGGQAIVGSVQRGEL